MSKQLARIEKVIQSLQNSFNKIDRQSNTMKQLYGTVTQLQRQMQRQIQQRQQRQRTQKKKGITAAMRLIHSPTIQINI
jgi:prefoldin subunit 5